MEKKYNSLIVGGSKGIGATILKTLIEDDKCEKIYICDIQQPIINSPKVIYKYINLASVDMSVFEKITDINRLYITAGIGKLNKFEEFNCKEIEKMLSVNLQSIALILSFYYDKINGNNDFYTMIMSSIAGHIVSPLYAVYSASKAGLSKLVQAINVELIANNKPNRILEVAPGSIKGTSFNGGETNINDNINLVKIITDKMLNKETLFIPDYDSVYKNIIAKNNEDYISFGLDSYKYKSKRPMQKGNLIVGYLSGTFDLFHIGHLNLIRKAKAQCDYLIVGVHKDASHKGKKTVISFEDRKSIVESCKYVDKAIMSLPEDTDAYNIFQCDKIFVGGDYKNSERFNNYEKYLENKDCKIIYFDYTPNISSTIIRDTLNENDK